MKLTIDVTEDDIRNGKRRIASQCPVRHAIARHASTRIDHLTVKPHTDFQCLGHWWSVSLDTKGGRLSFDLPRDVAARIERYDAGDEMEPFSFCIEL